MGCGASNTLEGSEFVKSELAQKTKYLKSIENEKILNKITEDNLDSAVADVENESDFKKLLEDMEIEFKENIEKEASKLTKEEIRDATMLRLAKHNINKDFVKDIGNVSEFMLDFIRDCPETSKNIAVKHFSKNVGSGKSAIFIDLENSKFSFTAKTIFTALKYDPEYANIGIIVVLTNDNLLADASLMKDLGGILKNHRSVKSFLLGIIDENNPISDYSNISYLFEGLSLSPVENFGILKVTDRNHSISEEAFQRIIKVIPKLELLSFGICNLSLNPEQKKQYLAAVSKMKFTNLLGVQFTPVDSDVSSVLNQLIGMKSLKCLILGSNLVDKNVEEEINKYQGILSEKIPGFEGLAIDYFKK